MAVNTDYPTWRYHPDKKACIVKTPAEDLALGDGWSDTPDGPALPRVPPDVAPPAAPPAPPVTLTPAEVWARVPAKLAADRVSVMTAVEDVRAAREWEEQHPVFTGGRKTVLAALTAREEELTPAGAAV